MPRNLVVFADGTGNAKSDDDRTNVAMLSDFATNGRVDPRRRDGPKPWQALDRPADLDGELARPDVMQLTHYIPGLGSEWGDIAGLATGGGISAKIIDGYDFLVRFYEPGDRIWLFGFSRGAYTARSLGGLVGLCGLPKRILGGTDLRHDAKARSALCQQAYEVYRIGSGLGEPGRVNREAAAAQFVREVAWPEHRADAARAPYFVGVWDTVRSLGIPIERYEVELPWWQYLFHNAELNADVAYACHALSIDDKRLQFHPTLWNEPTLAQRRGTGDRQHFKQVWFPGMHADVGGGYADRSLADIALEWMIDNARLPQTPLLFNADPMAKLKPDACGPMHDSRGNIFKRAIYKDVPRSVVRGVQDVEGRSVARRVALDQHADLHPSWADRLKYVPSYDTPHLRGHPEYDRIRPPP